MKSLFRSKPLNIFNSLHLTLTAWVWYTGQHLINNILNFKFRVWSDVQRNCFKRILYMPDNPSISQRNDWTCTKVKNDCATRRIEKRKWHNELRSLMISSRLMQRKAFFHHNEIVKNCYLPILCINSRVAQRKGAGLITHKSEDQNLALLEFFRPFLSLQVFLLKCSKCCLTLQHPACLAESWVGRDSSVHCPVRVPVKSKENIHWIF